MPSGPWRIQGKPGTDAYEQLDTGLVSQHEAGHIENSIKAAQEGTVFVVVGQFEI